ncbi:MAG: glycoside hydrolase family 97 N-terminal domain-containing protein [Bacteroidales bacterium]|nr:glycoside hydrolase family 97 N-terminal domain-containing protein [Bacteroidales bacterium]
MKKEILTIFIAVIIASGCSFQKKVDVYSPDGTIKIQIKQSDNNTVNSLVGFSVSSGGRTILLPSNLDIVLKNHDDISGFRITGTSTMKSDTIWINPFGERREVPDSYNQTTIYLESSSLKLNLICRAYNEGVAIAYVFPEQPGIDSIEIADERFTFRFPEDYKAWSAARAQAMYKHVPLSQIEKGCERPLVIEYDTTLTIALGEAKLIDYARMKFEPDSSGGISIRSRLDGEVKMALPFQSPWRYVMIGKNAGDLLEKNYFVLNLNDPSAIEDMSWIKPGKVLREVTLTTKGAIAAIDFTSSHNMQYVEFDAGWYGPENKDESDAKAVNLDPARSKGPLDMREVISYANSKNIGILLYVNRRALERQIDTLLPIYKEWGIKGIKFGFVQVGNQKVTGWLHESIKKAAQYQMVADVHDEYRTTGFSRTYPNFLTMEGIRGDEESPTNSHTLTTMFTRMIAGQGDNTICYYNERVDKKMGSHASQLAKAVCIFSPLQFIYWYDKASPSLKKDDGLWGTTNYIGDEPELEFFNNVPTVWDNTKVLYAKPGEIGVIAREKDKEWFVGGINGETARKLDIRLEFLSPGVKYSVKIYSDDPAIETRTRVRVDSTEVNNKTVLPVSLAANNGFAMHIRPLK